MYKPWENNLIYKVKAGSHAYGTNTETSDLDIRGVCMPYLDQLLGLPQFSFEQYNGEQGEDYQVYGIHKFLSLASDCNPNILEMLWCREEDILHIDAFGWALRNNRLLFLSKEIYYRCVSYAWAQVRRIQGHAKWLENPPEEPKPEAFSGRWEIDHYTWDNLNLKQAYQAEHKQWKNYSTWLANRNQIRHELELKYGYDCKHGSHVCRLMLMGIDALNTGQIKVYRDDSEWLLKVRNGLFTYNELMEWFGEKLKVADSLRDTTKLPEKTNKVEINKFLVMLCKRYYGIG